MNHPTARCGALVLAVLLAASLVGCGHRGQLLHRTASAPPTPGKQDRETASALPRVAAPKAAPCRLRSTDKGPTDLAEGPTDFTTAIRPQGKVKALMIFVDFPDAPATENVQQRYDTYAPAQDWYRTASYNRLDLRLDPVLRWVRMPKPSTAYGMKRGYSAETQARYIHDAVAAAKAADPSIDLAAHPMVDIVATLNTKAIDTGATAAYAGDPITVGDAQVRHAATFFGDDNELKYRVVAHETGHLFGLPDLYAESSDGSGNGKYVGEYDIMGQEVGAQPDFFAWHKQKLGWIAPEQIDCVTAPGTTEHRISPVETADGTKMAVITTGPNKAVAVEVRAKKGVDHDACRTGLLVYSVDTTTPMGQGPIRILGPRTPGADPCSAAPTLDTKPSSPQQYKDAATGTTITVRNENQDGSYNVTVTKT